MKYFIKKIYEFKFIPIFLLLSISFYLLINSDNSLININNNYSFKINAKQKYLYILDSGHDVPYKDNCKYKAIYDDEKNECFYEYQFNLDVRNYLASLLLDNSIEYLYLNDSGNRMSLNDRVKKVNAIVEEQKKYNTQCILISIHANYAKNKQAQAFEFYVQDSSKIKKTKYFDTNKNDISKSIQNIFLKHYSSTFAKKMGINWEFRNKTANFQILRETHCPSILLENNFFSNAQVRDKMWTNEYKFYCAFSIFKSIMELESLLI